jgi:hypothetical protein
MQPLLTALLNEKPRPVWNEIQSFPEETRLLWAQFASLKIQDRNYVSAVLSRRRLSESSANRHARKLTPGIPEAPALQRRQRCNDASRCEENTTSCAAARILAELAHGC